MESKWIVCDDQMPDMHEIYKDSPLTSGNLIVFNGHYVTMAAYEQTYTKRKCRWIDSMHRVNRVTHWMPLPEKP